MPQPELVVLDLRLADGSSPIGNVERLVAAGARVVAFTSGENPYMVRLAARAPVLGIVRKSAPIATLVDTLLRGAVGEPVMSTELASAMESDPDLNRAGLSRQEQQVLTLFATGVKAVAVASAVGIAESTVEDYVRRIRVKYARIGRPAHTKIDLYKRAIEDGFLPLPEQDHGTP
jgi:DNA-binding NarL/FixJ family response regulator